MSNLTKLFLLTICVSLAACSQEASKPKPATPKDRPVVEIETPDFSLIGEENETVSEDPEPLTDEVNIEPENFAPVIEELSFSMEDVKSALGEFQLSDDPQYLNCAYYGVKSCASQTVYQKSQEDKDASLCDLLDENETVSCKDNLWRSLASLEKDETLCDKISESFSRLDCRNSHYLAQAIAEKNSAFCEKIEPYEQADSPVIDPQLGPDGEPIAPDEGEEVVVGEPNNYLKEECQRQVEFAIEFNVEEPTIDPALAPVPEIPAVEVGVPEEAAPEAGALTTPEVLNPPAEISFPPEGEIPPEEPLPEA